MGSVKLQASTAADSEYNGGRAQKKGYREIKGRIEFICRLVLSC